MPVCLPCFVVRFLRRPLFSTCLFYARWQHEKQRRRNLIQRLSRGRPRRQCSEISKSSSGRAAPNEVSDWYKHHTQLVCLHTSFSLTSLLITAYCDLTTSSWSGVAFWSLCTFSAQLTVTAHFSMMIYVEVIMVVAIFLICLAFVKALVGCLVRNQELGEEMYAYGSTLLSQ